jgi:hypothetical protein
MSKIRRLHGEGKTNDDTTLKQATPTPVDLLDILAAQNHKLENAKYRASCLEKMEMPPQTATHTKLVGAIL